MGSRIRENPEHLFVAFCEVVIPSENATEAWVLQKYPDNFTDEELLKSVTEFSCPCEFSNLAVQHFSFVLTSVDGKWTYGYCRQAPNQPTLFCILSFLPWHETFYKLLNHIADLTNAPQPQCNSLTLFLEKLYNAPVPEPGTDLNITFNMKVFYVHCPNHLKLPSIPENRNLTEYFNAVDVHNMMVIFASMLHERRILIISQKLGRLSACVQAANMLIYPMHWQHIFIPVLPKHLLDYLSAPMPFLIGSHSSIMLKLELNDLGEVVILDADNNKVRTPFDDFETLPPEIVSSLKRRLKNPSAMLGNGVAKAFMKALVHLIGGYRDALKMDVGEKITFDTEAFIKTRPSSIQPFLETMLHLQVFQQFIEDRLEMLNSGIGFSDDFEHEVNLYEVNKSNRLRTQYKEWLGAMKKEGGIFLKNVRSKANPAVKNAYKSVKERGKKAYKDIRSKINEMQRHPSQPDLLYQVSDLKTKSAPSSPSLHMRNSSTLDSRLSYVADYGEEKSEGSILNSIPSLGARKYKMLTLDELSVASEDSLSDPEDVSAKLLDMDLMGDLQDIIFRRCSTSSNGLSKDGEKDIKDDLQTGESTVSSVGLDDPFSEDVFLPLPIPPPRTKRKQPSCPSICQANNSGSREKDQHLIKLDSVDDDIFDPLKAGPLLTDKDNVSCESVTKSIVDEPFPDEIPKSDTFRNLSQPASVRYPSVVESANCSNMIAHQASCSNVLHPVPTHFAVNSSFGLGNSASTSKGDSEGRPPLPPKTGLKLISEKNESLCAGGGLRTSTFFISPPRESYMPPSNSFSVNAQGENLLKLNEAKDDFDMFSGIVPGEKSKHCTWQKFS